MVLTEVNATSPTPRFDVLHRATAGEYTPKKNLNRSIYIEIDIMRNGSFLQLFA